MTTIVILIAIISAIIKVIAIGLSNHYYLLFAHSYLFNVQITISKKCYNYSRYSNLNSEDDFIFTTYFKLILMTIINDWLIIM